MCDFNLIGYHLLLFLHKFFKFLILNIVIIKLFLKFKKICAELSKKQNILFMFIVHYI